MRESANFIFQDVQHFLLLSFTAHSGLTTHFRVHLTICDSGSQLLCSVLTITKIS